MSNYNICDFYAHILNPRIKICECCSKYRNINDFPNDRFFNICSKCRDRGSVKCLRCHYSISFSSRFGYCSNGFALKRFFMCSECEGYEKCFGCGAFFPDCEKHLHEKNCAIRFTDRLGYLSNVNDCPHPTDVMISHTNFVFIPSCQY